MWEALFEHSFLQNAVLAGVLFSIACGIIGSYVVVKRIVFISGGIAHTSFGGVGLALWAGFSPLVGALIATIAAALGIGVIVRKTRLPEDTAIGVLWAMGMAMGAVFLWEAPGYLRDPTSYLFGSILAVQQSDLVLMLILDAIIVVMVVALYKEFLALSFDEEYGSVVGVPVGLLYVVLLCLIALTVVLLIRVVGIILVIAFLTIPPTLARRFTHSLGRMMLLSVVLGLVLSFGGLWLSYEVDWPSGATIILLSGTVLILSFGQSRLSRFWKERRAAAG